MRVISYFPSNSRQSFIGILVVERNLHDASKKRPINAGDYQSAAQTTLQINPADRNSVQGHKHTPKDSSSQFPIEKKDWMRSSVQWWKPPIYYSPVVPPLERGPDFSFLDGRRPAITSKWEFERRVKQVALAKKVVRYLAELEKAEEMYKQERQVVSLNQECIRKVLPKSKGEQTIS